MTDIGMFNDDPHIARIADALWSREPAGTAALLVGAGFSRNADPKGPCAGEMPGWNDIYKTMVEQLYPVAPIAGAGKNRSVGQREWMLRQTGATSAYLRVAEEYEAQFGRDALDKLILRNVPDNQFAPGKLHRMLVELPWADILTTNWDTLLERAAEKAEERVYDVLRTVEEIPEARAPRIVKLHGSFPAHRPFVFTEEDFRTYPARASAFVNLAQQLAMENTLVLLGFSGDDPNFLFWSGWVRDRLGPKAPLIYLVGVLDLTPAKRKMLEGRKIQPIDLAALPMLEDWPQSQRIARANQWFLERLRAAEPYSARRWPQVATGFVPPLELVTPQADPRAPEPDPVFGNDSGSLITLRKLVPHWAQHRSVYPGWLIPPLRTSEAIWSGIERHLREIILGLREMEEEERLNALFELNWQQERALIPLDLTVDDIASELLEALADRYADLSTDLAFRFRAIALALVRHAREMQDDALFARWANWLDARIADDPEACDRLIYERCLKLRSESDIDQLDALVRSWTVASDSFWNVRKAGLLADLGLDGEASALSARALNLIREQTSRGTKDIASWSRESFALLLRGSDLVGNYRTWTETQPVRERFDLRQEQLHAWGCPGKDDFFELMGRLVQDPPPFKSPLEISARFDMGSIYKTHHLSGIDPRYRRLLALQALRFVEEAGLPVRIASSGLAAQIFIEAAKWLIDVMPGRALDAFIIAAPSTSNKEFDAFLTRNAVSRIDAAEADRQIGRAIGLIAAARSRIEQGADEAQHWGDRLRSVTEVASRLVLRAPARAPELVRIALDLNLSQLPTGKVGIGKELSRLVRRSIEAASPGDQGAIILSLFESDIPQHDPKLINQLPDFASDLPLDLRADLPAGAWDGAISLLAERLVDPVRREIATHRLHWLHNADLLSPEQEEKCAEALWAPKFLINDLPGQTIFYPQAFLDLPKPKGVDVAGLVSKNIFTNEPITDDIMANGSLAFALDRRTVALTADQVGEQIEKLRAFLADHAPAPKHPEFFRDQRSDLVGGTSRAAAALARRSIGNNALKPAVAALAALDRYPLRKEPMIPALVALGLMSVEAAVAEIRWLLAETGSDDSAVVGVLADQIAQGAVCKELEAPLWAELVQAVAVRRRGPLARILRLLTHVLRVAPDRVPANLDGMLSMGLMLILSETDTAGPVTHPEYDPFLVRFYGALLVTMMAGRSRGESSMIAAWQEAIADDPLPNSRSAEAIAMRLLAMPLESNEDF